MIGTNFLTERPTAPCPAHGKHSFFPPFCLQGHEQIEQHYFLQKFPIDHAVRTFAQLCPSSLGPLKWGLGAWIGKPAMFSELKLTDINKGKITL